VLLVEDIVDSGTTLDHVLRLLQTRNRPAGVCVLLNKATALSTFNTYVGFLDRE